MYATILLASPRSMMRPRLNYRNLDNCHLSTARFHRHFAAAERKSESSRPKATFLHAALFIIC